MLDIHGGTVETLCEWFEDVAGLGGQISCGSRVVSLARDPGFGMDHVLATLFDRLATVYDPEGFWNPTLSTRNLVPSVANDGVMPGFLWLGAKAGPAGSVNAELARQLDSLARIFIRVESDRDEADGSARTRQAITTAIGPAANLLVKSVGAASLGSIKRSNTEGASWSTDIVGRARRSRESLTANIFESQDLVVRAMHRIAALSLQAQIPIVLVIDDADLADWVVAGIISALANVDGRVLVLVTGDNFPDGSTIAGDLGHWLSVPGDVAPKRLNVVHSEDVASVSEDLISAELVRLFPNLSPAQRVDLAANVSDLGHLAQLVCDDSFQGKSFEEIRSLLAIPEMDLSGFSEPALEVRRVAGALGGVVSAAVLSRLSVPLVGVDELNKLGYLLPVSQGLWQSDRRLFEGLGSSKRVWEAVADAVLGDDVFLASFEARQLARLVVSGFRQGLLLPDDDLSDRIFAFASAAANVDDYLDAYALGHGAIQVRKTPSHKQGWLAAIAYWETQLGASSFPARITLPAMPAIAEVASNLAWLARVDSLVDRSFGDELVTSTHRRLSEGNGFVEQPLLDHLRLEFVARLVEHGRFPDAMAQIRLLSEQSDERQQLEEALQAQDHTADRFADRLEHQLAAYEKTYPGSMELADCHRVMANLYEARGRFETARSQTRSRLKLLMQLMEVDDPLTLATRTTVCRLEGRLGRTEIASVMAVELAKASARTFGKDHPETYKKRATAARLLGRQGFRDDAMGRFSSLLVDLEARYGPGSVETFEVRFNMARLTRESGDVKGALEQYQKLLVDQEHMVGYEHRSPLTTRFQIAQATAELSDIHSALALFQRLYSDQSAVLGAEDPDTLATMSDTAGLTARMGDVDGAHELLGVLLVAQERTLGAGSGAALKTRGKIASLMRASGDQVAAMQLFQQLRLDQEKHLGIDHPQCLATRMGIATLTAESGDAETAKEMFEFLLDQHERVYGPDHDRTVAVRNKLAEQSSNGPDGETVLDLFRDLLAENERNLGSDHPETLSARANIARLTGEAGNRREALKLYRELLPDQRSALGSKHPDTLGTMSAIRQIASAPRNDET